MDIAAGTKGLNKASNVGDVSSDLRHVQGDIDNFARQFQRYGDSYSQQVNARLIADGGRNLDEIPTGTAGATKRGMDAVEQIRPTHWNALSESERVVLVTRLSESANPDDSVVFLNQLDDVQDVRHLIDEDVSTLNRLTEWYTNPGKHDYIDSAVSANDFVHVSRNIGLEDVRVVVKGSDEHQTRGSVQWLEEGSPQAGLEKIVRVHGDDFQKQLGSRSHERIKSVIYDAMKNPDHITQNPGGGTRYYINVDEADKPIRVATGNNGFTINAFPDSSAPI